MTTTFLTKRRFQKLADELEYLRTTKRKEVAERLHEAMEGGEIDRERRIRGCQERAGFR